MAFLCPSRRGRQKKKHKEPKTPFLGRITGSSSVDTLVRVGLEKQHGLTPDARMCITQDFFATTPGELSARQGDHVYRLYKEGDWIYVITELGQEGFVPAICLGDTRKSGGDAAEVVHKNRLHVPGLERRSSVDDGKSSTRHSSPKDSVSAAATYNVRNAEKERLGKRFINTSIHADEGSDVSSNSPLPLQHQINPLPKPARTHSIPDVISNASDSVTPDTKHRTTATDQFSPINEINNSYSKKSSNQISHNKYDNSDKLYHDRLSKHSNVLELPLMKAGARDSHTSNGDSITEVKTFIKKPGRKLAIVFAFEALEENDLKVQRGEVVTVLNEKDPDWVWVETKNRNQGFVPKSFTCPIPEDLLKMDEHSQTKSKPGLSKNHQPPSPTRPRNSNAHDVRELVMKSDFEAQSTDDISVKSGEQVFADLANQIEKDWLWVYAPASQSYGYIPKSNVRWIDSNDSSAVIKTSAIKSNNNSASATNIVGKPV